MGVTTVTNLRNHHFLGCLTIYQTTTTWLISINTITSYIHIEILELRELNNQSMRDVKIIPSSVSSPTYLGSQGRNGPDYWQARRAFLGSYRFSEASRTGRFKEKLRRSIVEMNEAAVGTVTDVRRGFSKRRFVIRVFRLKITLPTSSSVLVSMRCFIPTVEKHQSWSLCVSARACLYENCAWNLIMLYVGGHLRSQQEFKDKV